MRKKSHILLARYLADQMQTTASLQSHRKAFCLGSILPDIKPSFITRRHEFYGTFFAKTSTVSARFCVIATILNLVLPCMRKKKTGGDVLSVQTGNGSMLMNC